MPIDRAVEDFTVVGIIEIVLDQIRKIHEQRVKEDLDPDWVLENGPYLPLETLKDGMISVHEGYQELDRCWKHLLLTLRSRKADTEAVEKSMVTLASVSLCLALDIRARAVRTGTYVVDDKKERPLALEEVLVSADD
jgi:hypothetical protein